jgi:hypothetical protein
VEGPEKLYPVTKIVKSEERGHDEEVVGDATGAERCGVEGVIGLAFSRILYTIPVVWNWPLIGFVFYVV